MKIYLLLIIFCFTVSNLYSQSWKKLPTNDNAQKRHENAFVQAGKRFILIGGRGNKPIDVYNTENQSWKKGAQPPLEMHHSQAIAIDGLVYILGAFTGSWPTEDPIPNIYIYDPLEDLWIKGPEIPEDRRRGAAGVALKDKKIYIINGITNGHTSGWVNWFDEYDLYKNKWNVLPDSPNKRDHFQAAIIGNILFVAGGRKSGSVDGNGFAGTVKPTDIYDFDTKKWTSAEAIPTPRAGTAIGILDNNPVIIGGESDMQEAAHSEAEVFNLAKKTWETLSPMNQGRHGTQAISLNKQIIIGAGSGERGGSPELNTFEIFSHDNKLNFSTEAILAGSLKVSNTNLDFTNEETKSLRISHKGGNQAIVITDIKLSDNFKILNPKNLPFVLAPRSEFELKIQGNQNPGKLTITRSGRKELITVHLNNKN
ncbi:N-acetylneuraminic acid mutarotase [Salegentibacter holothuriorum]|uniref:N-acetylneuraminic acid mutarotase n=1 Tax=Salegentibacter holothuriorum TaxID=241145 RepID=A0A1T5D123_9FLAO|nr:kelch repeat-containing protein [Salegentibacter holothuriorum]SKB65404.1 N-acetylneuraminic acid mutarotase [Salegentibacter holothuriorum]